MQFETVLQGILDDGQELELAGQGVIDEGEGYTDGLFELVALPDSIDAPALGAFLFTGYPNSCRTRDAAVENPFSGGDYSYERTYKFLRSGLTARLDVHCRVSSDGEHLQSTFQLRGSVPRLQSVGGVSTIYEMWAPSSGLIEGLFDVAWLSQGTGNMIETANASSIYKPVGRNPLGGSVKHRYLDLTSHVQEDGRLKVTQQSNLISLGHAVS